MATERSWQVGDKIKGQFEIFQILGGPGKSGMGIVYVCYDHVSKVILAIKTIQDRYLQNTRAIDRFIREAKVWVSLEKHYNIVCAFVVDIIEGRPFILMEYVAGNRIYGTDLSGWIIQRGLQKDGKANLPQILDYSIQFCHGMIHAEKKLQKFGHSFVHRDIKPQNILITCDGVVKVTDFGLVKTFIELRQDVASEILGDESKHRLSFSKSGNIFGTPPYMSPEQCRGEKEIDGRADIYSFGCVLHEMLTSRFVFKAKEAKEFVFHHLHTKPEPLGIQRKLDQLVLKCLSKMPSDRYQNFIEVEKDLASIYYDITGRTIKIPTSQELKSWELHNKGTSLANLGMVSEAILNFKKALQMNPCLAMAHNNLGSIYTKMGNLDRAVIECKEALRLNPAAAEFHTNLGITYYKMGKISLAISEYKEALRLSPNIPEAHINLGATYNDLGKTDLAIAEYEEALKMEGNRDKAHLGLAAVYYKEGKLDKAVAEYREALRINPNLVDAHRWLGNTYKRLGNLGAAIIEYKKALKINPNYAEVYRDLGIAYRWAGNPNAAIVEYQKASRINPSDSQTHYNLGIAYKESGNLAKAIAEYKTALQICPSDAEANFNLGAIYETQGRDKEAIECFQNFIRFAPPQYVSYVQQIKERIRILQYKVNDNEVMF